MSENKTVIITGASGQLGKALSHSFSKAEYNLILLCRNSHKLNGFLKELPSERKASVVILEADMTDPKQLDRAFDEIRRRKIQPDVLVNNAAVQTLAPLEQISSDEWDHFMAVNLRAPHLCTRLFTEIGISAEIPDERSIVNIASIEGENPAENHAHYAASKSGLIQYTKASALELGHYGIRVNCISPGLIDRPGLEEAWPDGVDRYKRASPLGRLVKAEEVTAAVLFFCSPAASGISGVNLRVDTGMGATPGY